jgi:leader peptidase (prepilin peptidase)/N-methyltransferase
VDASLVVGCGVGGGVLGGVLDTLTGRIVRPPAGPEAGDAHVVPAEPGHTAGPVATAVSVAPAATVRRVAPPSEIALSALVTAAWFALAAARLGGVPALGAYCALGAGLLAASVVDGREGILPRVIVFVTLGALALGLVGASAADGHWRPLADAAIGGAVSFAVFFALWWVFPRGMGYGDVRLAGLIGVALGWLGFGVLYVGFLAAFVAGTVVGVVLMVRRGTGRKTRLPFGPALATGAAVGVLWGPWAVRLWLQHG